MELPLHNLFYRVGYDDPWSPATTSGVWATFDHLKQFETEGLGRRRDQWKDGGGQKREEEEEEEEWTDNKPVLICPPTQGHQSEQLS